MTQTPKAPPTPPNTLRDWFAGMALIAIGLEGGDKTPEQTAKEAFAQSDAMLRQRAK